MKHEKNMVHFYHLKLLLQLNGEKKRWQKLFHISDSMAKPWYPLFDMVAFRVQEKIRCLSWRLCWWPQCFFRPVLQIQDTTHSTEGFVPHGSHLGNHWIVVTTGTSTKMLTWIAWCSWNHQIQRKCTGRLTTLMCWCHCFYLVHVFVQCCVPFHLWYSRVATKGVVKLP